MKSIKITFVVPVLVALMFAVTAGAAGIDVPVADYWGVNGSFIQDFSPDSLGYQWLRLHRGGTATDTIEYVMDLGEIIPLAGIGIQNRSVATNYSPRRVKVYVAADESDSGFDPCDANSFTVQINLSAPSDDTLKNSTNAAHVKQYLGVNSNYDRRYVLVKITRTWYGFISGTNTYSDIQDVLASRVRYVTAGRFLGLADDVLSGYLDTATVSDYPELPDQLVRMTYNGGPTGDMRCDIVIDQFVSKDIQKVRFTNFTGFATKHNTKALSMWVAPASGAGSESDPNFDRLDKTSYSVKIFPQVGGGEGLFNPTTISPGVVREADVTDVSRRYVLMSIKSSFWGDMGTNATEQIYVFYSDGSDISILGTDSIDTCVDVIDLGLTLTADMCEDCYVNMLDMDKLSEEWLDCTAPGQAGCVQTSGGTPTYYIEPVPGGGIAVDGNLSEWPSDSEWILLDKFYYGEEPNDIVNYAKCSMRWDDSDNRIYVAIVVEDTNRIFEDDPCTYSSSDRIEIYSQGDGAGGTGWGADGTGDFDVAQQYIVGPNTVATGGHWTVWADLNDVDPSALESAVTVNGDQIVYELAVKQYDNYGGISGGSTVVTDLGVGTIIGFDIAVCTRWNNDTAYSMLAENVFIGKSDDAGQFQQYELANSLPQQYCGDWGYLDSDIVPDCYVNLKDFATMAIEWLNCNDPEDIDCVPNW